MYFLTEASCKAEVWEDTTLQDGPCSVNVLGFLLQRNRFFFNIPLPKGKDGVLPCTETLSESTW